MNMPSVYFNNHTAKWNYERQNNDDTEYIRADLANQPETNLLEEAYMRGFTQGAKEERKDLTPLINRLCEAILFGWKDAAELARKALTQIKEGEEEK